MVPPCLATIWMGDVEALAGAFADGFGGEERIEDLAAAFRRIPGRVSAIVTSICSSSARVRRRMAPRRPGCRRWRGRR